MEVIIARPSYRGNKKLNVNSKGIADSSASDLSDFGNTQGILEKKMMSSTKRKKKKKKKKSTSDHLRDVLGDSKLLELFGNHVAMEYANGF